MNDSRRKRLDLASTKISDAIAHLEEVRDEEQEAFDNLSEGLQATDKGQAMEAACAALEIALGDLAEALSNIEEAQA